MKKVLEITGLNEAKTANVVKGLSQLLADLHVYYANIRGFHWHIEGELFFALHSKFEEMYDDIAEKIDEVAERLLQLGVKPENRQSEYLKVAKIKEQTNQTTPAATLANIKESMTYLISLEREIIKAAQEAEDEVTVGLMVDYLGGQEKFAWMLTAFLKK